MDWDLFLICGTILAGWVARMWFRHRERAIELMAISRNTDLNDTTGDFAQLSREVAKLRDTTTQYDMSVERALEDIRHRLNAIEQTRAPRTYESPKPVASEQPKAVVGLQAGQSSDTQASE